MSVEAQTIEVFVAAGVLAHDTGLLPDALAELAIRLDLLGAGDLLDQMMRLDWTDGPAKQDPKPVPTPKPPPPPPPDPKGQS